MRLRHCPGPSDCSLKVFYESFADEKKAIWVDGPKTANLDDLKKIATKLGYKESGTSFSYTTPKTQKLVNISDDQDVKRMMKELPVISRDLEVHVKGVREKEKPEETPTILFWNCCTFGDSAIYMLQVLKAIYEPSIIFLIETRMASAVIEEISSSLGYYNVYACSSTTDEKSGGLPKIESKRKDFEKVVKECGLHSLPYEGCKFTWERGNVKQRLDRGLATVEWKRIFPSHRMVHSTHGGISDHIPIVIQTLYVLR
ncbi:hypothetical protein ACLB2K_051341 [Fragaria x ananassa]